MSPEMLAWKKKYSTCDHYFARYLGSSRGEYANKYCPVCRTHWYRGKEWNADEWDEYVNDI